nr:MAG TPA: hypothetical protein [Caudoviricetes sp.]
MKHKHLIWQCKHNLMQATHKRTKHKKGDNHGTAT